MILFTISIMFACTLYILVYISYILYMYVCISYISYMYIYIVYITVYMYIAYNALLYIINQLVVFMKRKTL